MAPAGHCEARSWPKQSPAMIEREIASQERLAMTDKIGRLRLDSAGGRAPSPFPNLVEDEEVNHEYR